MIPQDTRVEMICEKGMVNLEKMHTSGILLATPLKIMPKQNWQIPLSIHVKTTANLRHDTCKYSQITCHHTQINLRHVWLAVNINLVNSYLFHLLSMNYACFRTKYHVNRQLLKHVKESWIVSWIRGRGNSFVELCTVQLTVAFK